MPARRLLIVYGTRHGQTARIAGRLAERLTAWGHRVTLADVTALPAGLSPADFDGVVVGGSITFGTHQRAVRRFARTHRVALDAMPSAFFSVSGSAAGGAASRAEAHRRVDAFCADTGWCPTLRACIAGKIAYTQYDPFTCWLVQHVVGRQGGPTDVTRDHELTDWTQVERFAEAVAAATSAPAEAPQAPQAPQALERGWTRALVPA